MERDQLSQLRTAAPVVATHVAARAVVVWVYVVLDHGWKTLAWGDLGLYREWAAEILATGAAPAADTWMYPPAAVPVILAPELLPLPYDLAFITIFAAVDALVLVLLLADGRHRAGAWTWALLPPLLGPIVWARLDLVPVALTAVAVLWADRRPRVAGSAAALGTAVKAWPVLLGMLMLDRRQWLTWAVGSGAAIAAVATLVLGDAWKFITDLSGRGIQVESVLATPWLVIRATGGDAPGDYANGTYEILAPGTAELAAVSPALVILGVGAAWWFSRGRDPAVRWWAMALALLATSPLLSTQFILWIIGATAVAAAVPGVDGRLPRQALPVVTVIVALSHAGFPVQWYGLTDDGAQAAATVAIRNVLLLALATVVIVRLARTRVSSPAAAGEVAPRTPPTPGDDSPTPVLAPPTTTGPGPSRGS